jgi:hypothetical protein
MQMIILAESINFVTLKYSFLKIVVMSHTRFAHSHITAILKSQNREK